MFPQVFGKYVLERELASGGMAVVYLATLRGAGGFEKRLVVKQIRAELASDAAFVDRFVAEAKTTVELSHPNIVPVYELGVEQGVYFIAMELAQGVTLAELLRVSGKVTPEEGAYLGVEVCRALDYAHRKAGVVHRDVTPRNVLIDEEGAVRLIDFGIAAAVTGDNTAHERVFGSPGHMPSEQRRGGRLTPATDVFAIGALLLEAWSGTAPFRRATQDESDAALETVPPAPSETDPRLAPLDAIVRSAVAFKPEDRPQSADDLARPLREFLRNADLGDISRRLGAQVIDVRKRLERERRASSPSVRPGAPATPATRPLREVTSKTFATREIPATRPLEVASAPPAVEPSRDPPSRRAFAYAAFGVAAVVVAAFVGTRTHGVVERGPPRALPTMPTVQASISSASEEPPGAVGLPPIVSAAPVSSADPVPSSDEAPHAGLATLNLTADMPSRVTVDGSPQGSTPLRGLKRPAGSHVIVFASVELGERLTANVDVKSGQVTTVHAEFTRPTPALRIH